MPTYDLAPGNSRNRSPWWLHVMVIAVLLVMAAALVAAVYLIALVNHDLSVSSGQAPSPEVSVSQPSERSCDPPSPTDAVAAATVPTVTVTSPPTPITTVTSPTSTATTSPVPPTTRSVTAAPRRLVGDVSPPAVNTPAVPRPAAPSMSRASTPRTTTTTTASAPVGGFKNCTEARAAGAAPVRRGDPGYHPRLDRDGDGVGCE